MQAKLENQDEPWESSFTFHLLRTGIVWLMCHWIKRQEIGLLIQTP